MSGSAGSTSADGAWLTRAPSAASPPLVPSPASAGRAREREQGGLAAEGNEIPASMQ